MICPTNSNWRVFKENQEELVLVARNYESFTSLHSTRYGILTKDFLSIPSYNTSWIDSSMVLSLLREKVFFKGFVTEQSDSQKSIALYCYSQVKSVDKKLAVNKKLGKQILVAKIDLPYRSCQFIKVKI